MPGQARPGRAARFRRLSIRSATPAGRNPRTGETVAVDEKVVPFFQDRQVARSPQQPRRTRERPRQNRRRYTGLERGNGTKLAGACRGIEVGFQPG